MCRALVPRAQVRDRRAARSRRASSRRRSRSSARKALAGGRSAIGFYGDRGGEWIDETSGPGRGFLPEVCVEWERACDAAREAGLRVVNLRIGVALDPAGGALRAMLVPFRLGLGGRMGSGAQYVSWITLDDVVAAIRHCLVSTTLHGPVNASRRAQFRAHARSRACSTAFLRVPASVLRLALGQAADELLLGGAHLVGEARAQRLRVPRREIEPGCAGSWPEDRRANAPSVPTPGTSAPGSMPSERKATSHIRSAGVSKISFGVTSAVSHAPCASSPSS
jgi:uncharacterized protein (TIGR01777 family)